MPNFKHGFSEGRRDPQDVSNSLFYAQPPKAPKQQLFTNSDAAQKNAEMEEQLARTAWRDPLSNWNAPVTEAAEPAEIDVVAALGSHHPIRQQSQPEPSNEPIEPVVFKKKRQKYTAEELAELKKDGLE